MRKIFTLSAAFLCSMYVQAQQAHKSVSFFSPKAAATIPANPAPGKTTAADSRLIAGTESIYGASSFEITDSSVVFYTGNNGYDYATDGWKFDSGVIRTMNTSTMQWEISGRMQQQMANNRIMSSLFQSTNGSSWQDEQKTTYTYTNGLIATTEYEHNGGSGMEPTSRLTNTYNNDMQITENVQESWNNMTSQYVYSSRTVNHYNSNKQMDTTWNYSWNSMSAQWYQSGRNIITYTAGQSMTLQQTYNGSAWNDFHRNTSTYDNKGNLILSESEMWNTGSSSWEKSSRTEYAYDNANNNIEEKAAHWDNGAYVYHSKTNYTYNQFHRLLTEETQTWNASTSQWFYDTGDDYLSRYYYEPYTNDVKTMASNMAVVKVFPMPARDAMTIATSFNQAQPISVTLTDMNGRVVQQFTEQAGMHFRKSIDVSGIPAGNYILNMTGTSEQASRLISIAH